MSNISRPIQFQQKYKDALPTENTLRWILWKERAKLEAAGAVFKRGRSLFIDEEKFWSVMRADERPGGAGGGVGMSRPVTFDAVKAAAAGRWPEILAGLGIDPAALRNRHGPCPGCGGTDRFRFDDQDRGRFYCNGGGEPVSGDGFALLQHVHGWTAREALERVAQSIGMDSTDPAPITPRRAPPKPLQPSRTAAYALELWRKARTDDAVVGTHPYAISKGITWAAGAGRVVASGKIIGQHADCLLIPIRTEGTGKLQAVQCVNANGDKQTFGPIKGGCLLLGNTLDRSIPWYVAEGWASAASVVFHHHQGNAVCAVAFGKEQLLPVAKMLDAAFGAAITVLKEQDA